jgi:hypothetical protein
MSHLVQFQGICLGIRVYEIAIVRETQSSELKTQSYGSTISVPRISS